MGFRGLGLESPHPDAEALSDEASVGTWGRSKMTRTPKAISPTPNLLEGQ